jgi:hypothetical protein
MTPCAFPGCPNQKSPKAGMGLCNSHYWQLHKGRELAPLSYRRNVTEPWLLAHVGYEGSGCLAWPFQRLQTDGRAAVKWKGKQTIAARVMCELAHGKPPTPEHEAAHSCGKGHEGCVHPGHLSWKTHVDNMADQLIHGTRARGELHGASKLREADVHLIRASVGLISQAALAKQLGVQAAAVGKVARNERWGHI